MQIKGYTVILTLILVSLLGCSSTSNYLAKKPVILYPQDIFRQEQGLDTKLKSMQAMMDSFNDYKWEISNLDKEQGIIVAQVCRRGQHCVEVKATIRDDGIIEILRTAGQSLTEDQGIILQRWIERLKKAYKKHMK